MSALNFNGSPSNGLGGKHRKTNLFYLLEEPKRWCKSPFLLPVLKRYVLKNNILNLVEVHTIMVQIYIKTME